MPNLLKILLMELNKISEAYLGLTRMTLDLNLTFKLTLVSNNLNVILTVDHKELFCYIDTENKQRKIDIYSKKPKEKWS